MSLNMSLNLESPLNQHPASVLISATRLSLSLSCLSLDVKRTVPFPPLHALVTRSSMQFCLHHTLLTPLPFHKNKGAVLTPLRLPLSSHCLSDKMRHWGPSPFAHQCAAPNIYVPPRVKKALETGASAREADPLTSLKPSYPVCNSIHCHPPPPPPLLRSLLADLGLKPPSKASHHMALK